MIIQDILGKITSNSATFNKLKKQIDNSKIIHVTGLTGSARSFFVSFLAANINRPVLIIAPDINTALKYTIDAQNQTDAEIVYLPSQEASPYELVYSDSAVIKQQFNILESFKNGYSKAVVTTAKTLLNTYYSRKEIDRYSIKLEEKASNDPAVLAEKLVGIGYTRVPIVMDPGEFSLRGDILDIYPISEDPVRIEFWGDDIENIRYFDTDSQRSIKQIKSIIIEPRYKIVIPKNKDNKEQNFVYDSQDFLKEIFKAKEEQEKSLTESAKETLNITVENLATAFEIQTYFEGVEYFAPLITKELDDIVDYLPKNTLIICHESSELEQKLFVQDEKYKKEYEKNINEGLAVKIPTLLHKKPQEIIQKLQNFNMLNLDSFIQEGTGILEEIECKLIPRFMANLEEAANYISDQRKNGNNVLVVSEYPQRVADFLSKNECPYMFLAAETKQNIDTIIASKDVLLSKSGFTEGFILPQLKLTVITDTELFNKKLKKPTLAKRMSKRESLDFLVSTNDLNPGDFVVHINHGIGCFVGISNQVIDGQQRDYLTIEYANTDKLHMPAEQINLLSRYRGSGAHPKLSKMGGVEWNGIKNKVKKSIVDIAQDLLNLYAQRAKVIGFVYENDNPWQLEVEDAFPYAETPDQMQAIIDTKSDMESSKPMDRLICGDVGFGKTEVALRAVFKALLSGKQVAIMVPTTILAQQHYSTFVERFKPYPIKIDLLSRFKTPKEQRETIKNLITGDCDLVIGTHKLLGKDVKFKDIGLLVIDEEHKFGVVHKEKLKHLRAQIDVLTLSATPIPRTLYMSLSGVRDMSLINTPPVNRAPIKTYVGAFNKSLVRTAITHELEREGQVYFVHNRVQSIFKIAKDLQDLMPEVRIAVAHGQMNEKELEKIMYEFGAHEHDMLVCTSIIESGLDIPNVNTIIIDDADRFGLAQLYQLRGRVGRSETQAYSYCLYRHDKILTEDAKVRLKAIKDFNTLGSGYQIALRDLEIRGVGNILGSQQHGQMLAVGFDMYCSLLEDAVHELQGEKHTSKEPAIIDINITAFIPDDWVGDKEQKMIEYKRLADVKSLKELEIIEEEWKDRFGNIPIEVERLFKIIKLRLIATDIGINSVREIDGNIRIFNDYTLPEWRICLSKIPADILKRLRCIKAPSTTQQAKSIVILNCTGLFVQEQLNILEELFLKILEILK